MFITLSRLINSTDHYDILHKRCQRKGYKTFFILIKYYSEVIETGKETSIIMVLFIIKIYHKTLMVSDLFCIECKRFLNLRILKRNKRVHIDVCQTARARRISELSNFSRSVHSTRYLQPLVNRFISLRKTYIRFCWEILPGNTVNIYKRYCAKVYPLLTSRNQKNIPTSECT